MHERVIQVAIPHAGHDFYDYAYTDSLPIGARVLVPFQRKKVIGIVMGESSTSSYPGKLKAIAEVIDAVPWLDEATLAFYQWVARYYHARFADVLHLALPKQFKMGKVAAPAVRYTEAIQKPLSLLPEQAMAVDTIVAALSTYQCFILQGVTGSGKTEVYMQVCEEVLKQGKQVLVLVPEIGLTPQLIARFQARLDTPLVVLHSHLNDTERFLAFLAAKEKARVVLGTRSALFTPMTQLGLIIIDEEHDASFKQQEGVRYSARDAALMRAKQANIPVILGSATLSLETYYHASQQKYHLLTLTRKALESPRLQFEWVDLRKQVIQEGLTEYAYQKIDTHLKAGHQVLVFVNRRGFAPIWLCHDCGAIADCPACDRHFTVHKKSEALICHHCGLQKPLVSSCQRCQSQALITVGVGTQRLMQALKKRFPKVALAQMDRDALSKKDALSHALKDIQEEKTQLIVGTQLIAKGHHFPRLTLVVVVDVDAGFYNQDFRALERLGQILLSKIPWLDT